MKLIKATVEDFEIVFEIMDRAFPNTEKRVKEEQRALFNKPEYEVYMNEEKTGFIALWNFDCVVFLEHFAVAEEERGKGTGEKMLKAYIADCKKPMFLEAEPPLGEIEKRRIGFYERLGFFANPYQYIQPPLRETEKPIELIIMTYKNTIDEETFTNYKTLIYEKVYF